MNKQIQKLVMGILMLLAVGMQVVSCSSDNDDMNSDLVGYWVNDVSATSKNSYGGFYFSPKGEIWEWNVTDGFRYERLTGKWWETDSGFEIEFEIEQHSSDMLFRDIESVSKDRLVMCTWGGFAGIPYEEGTLTTFYKLDKAPGKRAVPGSVDTHIIY